MQSAAGVPAAPWVFKPESSRIQSVDIYRGLTMVVMIFVNELASVKGLPWWTYHMPSKQNGMTYVDVVFPAFLFVLGVTIPIAIERRIARGEPALKLWWHIVTRAFSLVVLGVILANARKSDPNLTGLHPETWAAIALAGAILFWLVYPKESRPSHGVLKYGGLVVLVAMLAIFRRTTRAGDVAWLDFRYWEILGLIGRVYFAAATLYILLRRWRAAPLVLLVTFVALNVASRMGMTPLQRVFPYALWPFDSGELPSIAMAGIVAWQIFFDEKIAATVQRKTVVAAVYGIALLAAGWACLPLGISKNAATPSWCLFTSGISVLLLLGIYWLADVHGYRRWAGFAHPAGANTLLTYLVPDVFYFTLGAAWANAMPGEGWPGVARALLFTALMLAVSAVLTRRGVRMQL